MASKVERVSVKCPKCGHGEALCTTVSFCVSFAEEGGDMDEVRARVYKCARCGYIWAVFSEV